MPRARPALRSGAVRGAVCASEAEERGCLVSKRVKVPKAVRGWGYVGAWANGNVGWYMPEFLPGWSRSASKAPISPRARENSFANAKRFYLCEITVTPVLDKRGRPITRICRKGGAS